MASYSGEKETRFLETVMKNRPDSLLFARLADAYRKEGNIGQAIELCVRGLNSYPYYITGRILLGRCYLEQQRYSEAIEAFSTVCTVDRRNQMAIKMLADIFVQQGMQQQAGELYALLLKMDPVNPTLSHLCSQYRSTAGDRDIFTILGLQSPLGVEAVPPDTGSTYPTGAEEMQLGVTDYTTVESSSAEPSQLTELEGDEMHTAGPIIDYSEQSEAVSGADISDRMSMLFDEQTLPALPETGAEGNFSEEHFDTVIDSGRDIDVGVENADVSGADISDRIEEIFNEQARVSPDKLPETSKGSTSLDQSPKQWIDDASEVSLSGQDFDFSDISVETVQINKSGRDISFEPADTDIDMPQDNVSGIQEADGGLSIPESDIEPLPMTNDSSMESGDVSGADVSKRIEELFSDQPSDGEELMPEAQLQGISDTESAIGSTRQEVESTIGPEPVGSQEVNEVAGSDVSDRIDTLFEGSDAEAPEAIAEPDLQLEEFTESGTAPEFFIDSSSDSEIVVSKEINEVSGSDVSDRIDELSEASEKESSETIPEQELQLEIPEMGGPIDFFTESSALPQETLSPEEENVSGSDVSHRMEELFEAPDGTFTQEQVQEGQSDGEAEFALRSTGDELQSDHDEIILSDSSMMQTAEELFADENISGEHVGTTEEESVFEPDLTSSKFAETMQFDHELFEQMLHPSDKDAALLEGQTLIDATLPDEGTPPEPSASTDRFATDGVEDFEFIATGSNDFEATADRPVDQLDELFTRGSELKGDDQTFELPPEAPDEKAGFEVTTEQFAPEGPELVIDAEDSSDGAVLDSTATFERATDERKEEEPYLNLILDTEETGGVPSASDFPEERDIHTEDLISEAPVDDGAAGDHTDGIDAAPSGEDVVGQLERLFPNEAVPKQTVDDREGTDRDRIDGATMDESLIAEVSPGDADEDDAAFIETMQMTRDELLPEEAVVPEAHFEVQPIDGSDVATPVHPEMEDQIDGPPVISGSDVSDRLDDLFPPADLMSLSTDGATLPEDDQNEVMEQVSEFYTISGEDASRGIAGELPEDIAEVEFDTESSTDSSAASALTIDQVQEEGPISGDTRQAVSSDAEILPEVELYEEFTPEKMSSEDLSAAVQKATLPDGRDQPFSIPDHVLTPTLADIYYQQGQHQLAVQIYRRLLERDPENDQLIARLREIQSAIEQNIIPELQPSSSVSRRRTAAGRAGRNRSSAEKRDDPRPLAGVHLKKQVKNAAKIARKRKS